MPVYKRKNVWWVRFQIKGKRIAFSVPEAKNKEQAKQAETKAMSEAFSNKYGSPTGDITFVAQRFFEGEADHGLFQEEAS
jgi:hypothetical protein